MCGRTWPLPPPAPLHQPTNRNIDDLFSQQQARTERERKRDRERGSEGSSGSLANLRYSVADLELPL